MVDIWRTMEVFSNTMTNKSRYDIHIVLACNILNESTFNIWKQINHLVDLFNTLIEEHTNVLEWNKIITRFNGFVQTEFCHFD